MLGSSHHTRRPNREPHRTPNRFPIRFPIRFPYRTETQPNTAFESGHSVALGRGILTDVFHHKVQRKSPDAVALLRRILRTNFARFRVGALGAHEPPSAQKSSRIRPHFISASTSRFVCSCNFLTISSPNLRRRLLTKTSWRHARTPAWRTAPGARLPPPPHPRRSVGTNLARIANFRPLFVEIPWSTLAAPPP